MSDIYDKMGNDINKETLKNKNLDELRQQENKIQEEKQKLNNNINNLKGNVKKQEGEKERINREITDLEKEIKNIEEQRTNTWIFDIKKKYELKERTNSILLKIKSHESEKADTIKDIEFKKEIIKKYNKDKAKIKDLEEYISTCIKEKETEEQIKQKNKYFLRQYPQLLLFYYEFIELLEEFDSVVDKNLPSDYKNMLLVGLTDEKKEDIIEIEMKKIFKFAREASFDGFNYHVSEARKYYDKPLRELMVSYSWNKSNEIEFYCQPIEKRNIDYDEEFNKAREKKSELQDKYHKLNESERYEGYSGEIKIEVNEKCFNLESKRIILELIQYSSNMLMCAFNASKMLDKFTTNNELMKIYDNLIKAECSRSYMTEKIYSICSELYTDYFDNDFTKKEIAVLIYLMDTEYLPNIDKIKIKDKIETEEQLIKIIVKSLNDIEYTEFFRYYKKNIQMVSEKIILSIGLLLKKESIDAKLQDNIICNINEICGKVYKKWAEKGLEKELKKQKKKDLENAKKEKDRLLKGDISIEERCASQEYEKNRLIKKLKLDFNEINNGYEFEEYVSNLYKLLGYEIEEVTKKSGDQGADVVAEKYGEKYVIQAKFYSNPVGNKAVQEIVAAIKMYNADKGIVITNNAFTKSAKELAKANEIELVDGNKIEQFKRQILKN